MAVYVPIGRRRKSSFVFKEFFEMGLEESASPFLNPFAKKISTNLSLKASFCAALLLAISFALSFFLPHLAQILLVGVYLIAGTPLLIDSVEDIVHRFDINIDVLMTLAAFAAYFLGAGFEGALLIVLFSISGALENSVSLKTKNALSSLYSLAPTKAYVCKENGSTFERAVQDIEVGNVILVRAGEVVPLDGIIVKGSCSVNLQHLTGESTPISKKEGDIVPAGAKTIEGALTIQVTHTSSDSTLARIIQLMMQAQEKKPKLERWFDRFSRIYAITIISFSCLFALYFAHVVGIPYLGTHGAIYRALAFLITASPCALIIAVPTAYLSSLGACAKKGIVLKGGVVFDALNSCNMIAFDKTGTLTLGELSLVSMDAVDGASCNEKEILAFAAALERNAVHPVAKAILLNAQEKNLHFAHATAVRVIPGIGIEGVVQNTKVFIGDIEALQHYAPKHMKAIMSLAKNKREKGLITSSLVIGEKAYLLSFSDQVRPGVRSMLSHLREDNKKIVMLTGDHLESARQIAEKVGIQEFYADLQPEDKLNMIEKFSKEYGLAMVGDGVNDAPALARATVGIALGKIGSATTQSVADVILLHDNVEILDSLFIKAQKTKKIVMQNLAMAMSVIVFASVPALSGYLPLWLAVILHEGGTFLVALNAIRLLRD